MKNPPQKFTVKDSTEAFAHLDKCLRSLKTQTLILKSFLQERGRIFMMNYLLISKSYKQNKTKKQANPHGPISEKRHHKDSPSGGIAGGRRGITGGDSPVAFCLRRPRRGTRCGWAQKIQTLCRPRLVSVPEVLTQMFIKPKIIIINNNTASKKF